MTPIDNEEDLPLCWYWARGLLLDVAEIRPTATQTDRASDRRPFLLATAIRSLPGRSIRCSCDESTPPNTDFKDRRKTRMARCTLFYPRRRWHMIAAKAANYQRGAGSEKSR